MGMRTQPVRVDSSDLRHVLFRREDELVVDNPLRIAVEERRGRVDVHRRALDEGLVALLRVLLRRVAEVSRADRAPDPVIILASR